MLKLHEAELVRISDCNKISKQRMNELSRRNVTK